MSENEQNFNALTPVTEQEKLIDLKEAANRMGTSYSAFSGWLNKHEDLKNKYCFKSNINGRKKLCIRISDLVVIMNLKNLNNQKIENMSIFQNGKEKIAEVAMFLKLTFLEGKKENSFLINTHLKKFMFILSEGVVL